jgi:hypothetical protein
MATSYVEVEFESDEQTLADNAIDRLRARYDDYEPNDGDLEVVLIEAIAPMAANAARVAGLVPSAVFRQILLSLHGLAYGEGAPATTTVTFQLVDGNPHKIDAGSEVLIDGWVFRVNDTVTNAAGVPTIPAVAVTADQDGEAGNGLVGDVTEPLTALAAVTGFTVDTPTDGGEDPEDDLDFQNKGARELRLQAKTLVTTEDYELMALSVAGVGRAVAISNAATRTIDVYITDIGGDATPLTVKDALAALYEQFRLSTWAVNIYDATYTSVAVAYTVKAYPGFDHADLIARIDDVLTDVLSPGSWGRPKNFGDPGSALGWTVDTVVRRLKLVDLIGDVDGVDYVVDLTITGAAGGPRAANGDWPLPGTLPLPTPGVFTGAVT